MGRDIKFRGLSSDGKGWVFGNFIHNKIDCPCIVDIEAEQYEVKPETVGQFTGLTDKNGKEIYEGDKDHLGRVMLWNDDMTLLCWHYYNEFRESYYPSSYPCLKNDSNKLIIIGNIHEK